MRMKVWLSCMLLVTGLATCEELMDDASPESSGLNNTDTEGTNPGGNNTEEGSTESSSPEATTAGNASAETSAPSTETATTSESTTTSEVSTTEATMPAEPTATGNASAENPVITASPSPPEPSATENASDERQPPTTKKNRRTRKPKPTTRTKKTKRLTKRPTTPHPDENGEYGIYIDSHGCEHRTLQTGGNFFTATCQVKCGKDYYKARDGNPCLYPLRRSARLGTRGKLCTMGLCRQGRCAGPFIGEVSCQVPTGTAQYYDDYAYSGVGDTYDGYNNNYQDGYTGDYQYGYHDNHYDSNGYNE